MGARVHLHALPERNNPARGARRAAHSFTQPVEITMIRSLLIGAIVLGGIAPAVAHVTLEAQEANIGMPYKAVLRVPHGCEGSATVTLRVRIPDGVIAVKPMPKPGWMLSTNNGQYSKTYTFFQNSL
jgi:uncharacterized protein YcnI